MRKISFRWLLCLMVFAVFFTSCTALAADSGSFILDGEWYDFYLYDLKAKDSDGGYADVPLKQTSGSIEAISTIDGDYNRITFTKWLESKYTNNGDWITFNCDFGVCETVATGSVDAGKWLVPGYNTLLVDYIAEYTLTRSNDMAHSVDADVWYSNGDGTHSLKCTRNCGFIAGTMPCSGGTATETQRAVCEVCNEEYGSLLIPETGDHANLALWVFLLAVSAAGMATILRQKKREY